MFAIIRRVVATAATLAAGTAGLGTTLVGVSGPAQAAAPAAALPGCVATDLAVSLGRLDAGAGNRYQDVRIANVGDHDCKLTGYPKFRFAVDGAKVGVGSQHQGMAVSPVKLQVGDSAWSTIWYTDPGPVPAADCRAVETTSVLVKLPHRAHRFEVALSADVCTTKDYRPVAYPVRDRAVF